MPTEKDPEDTEITPDQQHSYFYTTFIILVGILVVNLLLTILFSVFNFYNFDYTDFYSVIIFYIFMLSCRLVLPTLMPFETSGLEYVTATIQKSATSAYDKMGFAKAETALERQPPAQSYTQGQAVFAQPPGQGQGQTVVQSRPISSPNTDDTEYLIPKKKGGRTKKNNILYI